jgi:hypothetical protein
VDRQITECVLSDIAKDAAYSSYLL